MWLVTTNAHDENIAHFHHQQKRGKIMFCKAIRSSPRPPGNLRLFLLFTFTVSPSHLKTILLKVQYDRKGSRENCDFHMTRVQVQLSKLSHRVIANLSKGDIFKMEFSRHLIIPQITIFLTMYNMLGKRKLFLWEITVETPKTAQNRPNFVHTKIIHSTLTAFW